LCAFSKLSAFFTNIHLLAHIQVQTIIEVGVANHKAQGQAIISTVINEVKEKINVSQTKKYQITKDNIAIVITIQTKYHETISAILAIGAFEF
jgi:hypothetical protein